MMTPQTILPPKCEKAFLSFQSNQPPSSSSSAPESLAMHAPEKPTVYLLLLFPLFLFISPSSTLPSTTNSNPTSFCGKIRIKTPLSTSLNRLLLCKSQKLYFRTSLGLFPVSSIDYESKTLIISHSSCSPSSHFISPSLFSAGLRPSPQPNSVLLFNCNSSGKEPISSFPHNCSSFYGCRPQEQPFSCLLVDDAEKLKSGFHPEDLSCSHYRRVHRSSSPSSVDGFELGTRVSFEIPDHLPRICDECSKPNGNCGVGLRCICHSKDCKDKVLSDGVRPHPFGSPLFSFISFAAVMLFVGIGTG